MGRSKKNVEVPEENQEPIVEIQELGEAVGAVEVVDTESPDTESPDTGQETGQQVEETPQQVAEEEDPKLKTLKEFAQYWKENQLGKQRVVKFEVARAVFNYWKQYTGRPEIFTGCSSCMSSKTIFMLKKCKENGIEL